VLSAAVLAACGQIENRRPAGPINGPSQWVHGCAAASVRKPSLRHTLTGFVIHHVTATAGPCSTSASVQLTRKSLLAVYAAFAIGLALVKSRKHT
jgi:hypothetical protein